MKNKKTNRKKKSTSHASSQNAVDKLISSSILGLALSVGISIALLLIGSLIAISTNDPLALVDPIGYVSLFLASFLGGFACSKLNKQSPYLTGTVCGGAFVLLSMLISFSLPHTLSSGIDIWLRLALHVLSLALFPVGAIFGIKASRPKRRRKR